MTKVLLLSKNEAFAADLKEQINLNIPFAEVFVNVDGENFSIIVSDETIKNKNHNDAQMIILEKPVRLVALLKKLQTACLNIRNVIEFNGYRLDMARKEMLNLNSDESIKITEKEVAILKCLYEYAPDMVSKNDLLQEVWEYSPEATTHTVETHIYRLRQKIEKEGNAPLILTEEGGYRLSE